jgi:hypothetical protein
MDTSTSPQPPAHLATPGHHAHSLSTPNTPLSHAYSYYGQQQQEHAMPVDMPPPPPPPPQRRREGFKRVRDARDLQPNLNPTQANQRMDHVTGEMLTVRGLRRSRLITH